MFRIPTQSYITDYAFDRCGVEIEHRHFFIDNIERNYAIVLRKQHCIGQCQHSQCQQPQLSFYFSFRGSLSHTASQSK